jgi:hypothetical protein
MIKEKDFDKESCLGFIYSNFDHVLEEEKVPLLETLGSWAEHGAYNFYGIIWFENNKYKEEVFQYQMSQGVFEADSIEDLIKKVIEIFGSE